MQSHDQVHSENSSIGDYIITDRIAETNNSIIYRGHKKNENDSVIIKSLKKDFPSAADIARIKQENNIIKNLVGEIKKKN